MGYYIIIRGPLGSGKSTISKRLSVSLKAKCISIDRILEEHNLEKWEKGYISQDSFLKVNEIAAAKAIRLLEKGVVVIFDGNFYYKSQIKDLVKRLGKHKPFVFTLKIPLKVCIERDSKRKKPLGAEAATDVYRKSTEFDYGIGIDATKPKDKMLERILFCLQTGTNLL